MDDIADNDRLERIDAVFDSFMGYANLERGQSVGEFKLDRMKALALALGRPELSYRVIHVAGSKGKGSTSSFIAGILREAGYRVGLYTSPHVLHWAERVALSGEDLPAAIFEAEARRLRGIISSWEADNFKGLGTPSFFEIITLLGFLCFKAAACDWVVLETGLGGRLDSTNIVQSEASVITAIELEHTEYLGNSLESIAFEKAGIIKPGKPCFIGALRPEAEGVIAERARNLSAPLYRLESAARVTSYTASAAGAEVAIALCGGKNLGPAREIRTSLGLMGRIQAENAGLAAACVSALLPEIPDSAFARGLGQTRLRARFETLSREPLIVADGAHTADSVRLCAESWAALCPRSATEGTLLFACAADKNKEAMAQILAPLFRRVVVTSPGSFKKSDPLSVFNAFGHEDCSVTLEPDTLAAARLALGFGGPLLVTGSFYLAAEFIKIIRT
jgi:dihydrofolate synthase/folylpolyglutamate synthase